MLNKSKLTPRIAHILDELSQSTQALLGDKLKKIILFGSYARGDYTEDSDLDIMVLADFDAQEESRLEDLLNKISSGTSLAYDLTVCMLVNNAQLFNNRLHISPFYRNVVSEGVEIYA